MTMGRWDGWVPGNGAGDKSQHPSPPWTGRGSRGGVMTPALTMDDGRWTMGAGEWGRRLFSAGRTGLEAVPTSGNGGGGAAGGGSWQGGGGGGECVAWWRGVDPACA